MHLNMSHAHTDNLNYGIIGNCKSSAIINEDSSIDWCCLPQFDSPSVFGKILDAEIGGSFKISTDDSYEITQEYLDKTCILKTKFDNGEDAFELCDFMPRYQKENGVYYAPPEITRVFKLIKGSPKFKVIYDPRLEYSQGETSTYIICSFSSLSGIKSTIKSINFLTILTCPNFVITLITIEASLIQQNL